MTEKQQWAKFGGGITITESSFNESVGGGFLDVGTHKNLIIASVEPYKSKTNKDMLKFRYENEAEEGTNSFVMLEGTDKEGKPCLHFAYKSLGIALCGDDALRLKFFGEHLPKNPEDFKVLVGFRLSLQIIDGTEGYKVLDVETGGKQLIDIETGNKFEGTDTYSDFTEAKEAAEEMGLQQCYTQIKRIFKAEKEFKEANEKIIADHLSGAKPKKAKSVKEKVMPEIINVDDIEV